VNLPAVRIGVFVGALALLFVAAFAVGSLADPITSAGEPDPAHAGGGSEEGTHDAAPEAGAALPGLAVSEAGYTLEPVRTRYPAGPDAEFRFAITDSDGEAVTDYVRSHQKDLHLIVVRRDLAGYQHVHPTRDADGTWSVPLDLSRAGTWRVFADFTPAGLGRGLTLGTDIAVPGRFTPQRLPAPATRTNVDGYDVTLTGTATPGEESELTFTVSRNGREVTDVQPYLGALGHLVSLRAADLAYLHTHAEEGADVRFATEFPTAGTYRLFLDFKHDDQVHTAQFTVAVPGAHAGQGGHG
jgi:hypothetical protein